MLLLSSLLIQGVSGLAGLSWRNADPQSKRPVVSGGFAKDPAYVPAHFQPLITAAAADAFQQHSQE